VKFFPALGNHGNTLVYFILIGNRMGHIQYLWSQEFTVFSNTQLPPQLSSTFQLRPILQYRSHYFRRYFPTFSMLIPDKPQLSGLVELFAINSNLHNGNISDPAQQQWLKDALGNSTARWKIVYFHHPPYTTAEHDPPATWMHWPFAEYGASIVLNGHEHDYERIIYEGMTYVVNGLGGKEFYWNFLKYMLGHPWLYEITGPECNPFPGSQVRYNGDHGAMLGFATKESIEFCFYSLENGVSKIDEFQL
jgi:hypothetical protein